jgi:chemotaxis-related protein WspB
MTFLLFQIGADRYALEIRRVAEALPRVKLKTIPQAAAGIAGVFNYHGQPVPVVDLTALVSGRPGSSSLSTRLLVVHCAAADGTPHLLGLLAEQATATARFEPQDFKEPGVTTTGTPYLGPVISDTRGLIQWVEIEKLLSPEVRGQLWRQAEVAA